MVASLATRAKSYRQQTTASGGFAWLHPHISFQKQISEFVFIEHIYLSFHYFIHTVSTVSTEQCFLL